MKFITAAIRKIDCSVKTAEGIHGATTDRPKHISQRPKKEKIEKVRGLFIYMMATNFHNIRHSTSKNAKEYRRGGIQRDPHKDVLLIQLNSQKLKTRRQ